MEFIFELIGEIFCEIFVAVYIELMTLIVPEKIQKEIPEEKIKHAVVYFILFLIAMALLGLFLWTSANPHIKTAGKCMMIAPLVISVIQIIAGIILHFVRKKKK